MPEDPPWLLLDWPRLIEGCVPHLQHDRGKRWPLVIWDATSGAPFTDRTARVLLERGIVAPVRLDPAAIPVAQQIQKAGAPVILLDSRTGSWPYDLAGDPAKWALSFPKDAQVPDAWRRVPVPGRLDGWQLAAQRLRDVLGQFRDAGVRVDAVWFDYENAPANVPYEAVKASREAGREVPAAALRNAEAFDRYLGRGRPAYRSRLRLSVGEAVRLTRALGGIAVVAHPHTIADDRDGFEEAFARFAGLGIAGVECYYVEYPPDHRLRLAALAESHGLIATGGSDYHGRYKPGIAVGVGRGDLVVPDPVLSELSRARHTR